MLQPLLTSPQPQPHSCLLRAPDTSRRTFTFALPAYQSALPSRDKYSFEMEDVLRIFDGPDADNEMYMELTLGLYSRSFLASLYVLIFRSTGHVQALRSLTRPYSSFAIRFTLAISRSLIDDKRLCVKREPSFIHANYQLFNVDR